MSGDLARVEGTWVLAAALVREADRDYDAPRRAAGRGGGPGGGARRPLSRRTRCSSVSSRDGARRRHRDEAAARTPGVLTTGPLRPVILRLALPAVAMMACHFTFGVIDAMWVGRIIGPAALAAVSTAGFYVWILLNLGEMVEVGLIAVAARRHGEGLPTGPPAPRAPRCSTPSPRV